MKLTENDPRIAAYVLDELPPGEREAVEAALQSSERAHAEATEVYEAASWLKSALAAAPAVGLDAVRSATVEAALAGDQRAEDPGAPLPNGSRSSRRTPSSAAGLFWRWALGGLAFGCSLVMLTAWWWSRSTPQPLAALDLEAARAAAGTRPPAPGSQDPSVAPAEPVVPVAPPPVVQPPATSSPMMDIRMMMRYGLVPRGMKITLPDDGAGSPPAAVPGPQPGSDPTDAYRYAGRPGAGSAAAGEAYAGFVENAFLDPATTPLSTFGLDVDTASYSNVRRFLNSGQLPPRDAVRLEELVNAFSYGYPAPAGADVFAIHPEVGTCPWNPWHRLVRIGIKARGFAGGQRPAANLTFLVDVSGSMNSPDKLPLLKQGLRMLVERLRPDDTVAIVVYADSSRVVLPPTPGDRRDVILAALEGLEASGSTNGGSGLQTAYDLAAGRFVVAGANRVILCTDGDFNVGLTDPAALVQVIRRRASAGIYLSVLGFGTGNLKDATMERLADEGNGHYAYLDSLNEAHRVLAAGLNSSLTVVARDARVQVEFNPAHVQRYRLLGYENRALAPEDFNNDRRDAGEVGAGQTITVLYEILPVGVTGSDPRIDPLRYQPGARRERPAGRPVELLTVKLRYQEPGGGVSHRLELPVLDAGAALPATSDDFRFAASVAGFGLALRNSPHRGTATVASLMPLAAAALGADPDGERAAYLQLLQRAARLIP